MSASSSRIAAIGAIALLAGCASHMDVVRKEAVQRNAAFIGQSSQLVLQDKGAPSGKDVLSTGEEVWTYRRERQGMARGSLTTWTFNPAFGSSIVTWNETMVFVVGRDGNIARATITVD